MNEHGKNTRLVISACLNFVTDCELTWCVIYGSLCIQCGMVHAILFPHISVSHLLCTFKSVWRPSGIVENIWLSKLLVAFALTITSHQLFAKKKKKKKCKALGFPKQLYAKLKVEVGKQKEVSSKGKTIDRKCKIVISG